MLLEIFLEGKLLILLLVVVIINIITVIIISVLPQTSLAAWHRNEYSPLETMTQTTSLALLGAAACSEIPRIGRITLNAGD